MSLATYARDLNSGCGVGFWQRRDAEGFARCETARDGQPRVVTPVFTARRTHVLHFVQTESEEATDGS